VDYVFLFLRSSKIFLLRYETFLMEFRTSMILSVVSTGCSFSKEACKKCLNIVIAKCM